MNTLAVISVILGILSSLVIAVDIATGRLQSMRIMNTVWILTGLWGGVLALAAYFRFGRQQTQMQVPAMSTSKRMASPPVVTSAEIEEREIQPKTTTK